jgi:hypothetical protein
MKKIEEAICVIGCVIVSLIVIIGFMVMCYLVISKTIPDSPAANQMLGSLGTMATGVVYYWTGSSRGSSAKDRIIEQQLANKP